MVRPIARRSFVATGGIGAVPIPLGDVWRALLDPAAPQAGIVRDLRLPRVLLGFLIGGTLAVSGASLQALLRNPLASPDLRHPTVAGQRRIATLFYAALMHGYAGFRRAHVGQPLPALDTSAAGG